MKPLPIKEQIKVLKKLNRTLDIWGMCPILYNILKEYGIQPNKRTCDYIPSFTRDNYLYFYPSVKVVQAHKNNIFWDNSSISGRLRRRWFIRHLIKELKKQL